MMQVVSSNKMLATHRIISAITIYMLASTGTSAAGFFDNIKREVGSCLSGGCDVIWHANRSIDSGINSKVESAVGPIKIAMLDILNQLFKDDLDPMLDKVNSISEQRLSQIGKIIQDAITSARSATEDTIDDVKTKIIVEGANQVKGISAELVKDVSCAELKTQTQVQSFIDENFRIFGTLRDATLGLFDNCQYGIDRSNYWTVYSALKCRYEKRIARASTIGEMQQYYHGFLEETAKAECILDADANKEDARRDQVAFSQRLRLWSLALE